MTGHSDPCSFRRLSIAVIFFIPAFTCARKKAARCVHLVDICFTPSCSFPHRPYPTFPSIFQSTFNPLPAFFSVIFPVFCPVPLQYFKLCIRPVSGCNRSFETTLLLLSAHRIYYTQIVGCVARNVTERDICVTIWNVLDN